MPVRKTLKKKRGGGNNNIIIKNLEKKFDDKECSKAKKLSTDDCKKIYAEFIKRKEELEREQEQEPEQEPIRQTTPLDLTSYRNNPASVRRANHLTQVQSDLNKSGEVYPGHKSAFNSYGGSRKKRTLKKGGCPKRKQSKTRKARK